VLPLFLPVIKKAKEACINSTQNENEHFEDVLDMVQIGSGAKRQYEFWWEVVHEKWEVVHDNISFFTMLSETF